MYKEGKRSLKPISKGYLYVVERQKAKDKSKKLRNEETKSPKAGIKVKD